ncbi:GNAT family N-acetyltransferase [bacterium]|jgi:ribosomal protein S18 acetylase RimI-like enzyme|nr:GNAT family N-acetyltransferase [bacterium]
MIKFSKYTKIFLLIGFIFILSFGGYFLALPREGVYDFRAKYDTNLLYEVIEQDWDFLVLQAPEGYYKNYVDFFVKNKGTIRNPNTWGKNTIKVYYHKGEPAGFVSYYKKNTYVGDILFLSVKKSMRGKGIGRKLLLYSINKLFKDGCIKIDLVTLVDNKPARHLYESIGFEVGGIEDSGIIRYRKMKK